MLTLAKKVVQSSLETGPILALRKKAYDDKFKTNRELNLFRGVFSSFSEAEAAIDSGVNASYDNIDSANLYKSFCEKLFPGDYPNLFWLTQILPGQKSLFDLGGHIGVKYYSYSRYLDLPSGFNWSVHDMPAVMIEGEKFAKQTDPKGILSFSKDLELADGFDILCAFGSLQYIDIDLAKKVAAFKKKPQFVVATIPASEKATYYTVNSIGTAQCPYIIRKKSEFISSFEMAGYKLREFWTVPDKKCEIPFHPGYSLNFYSGFLFERVD